MTALSDDIVVTGLGATTPLGGDVATFWAGLLEGRSGVVALTEDWAAGLKVRIADGALKGEVYEYIGPTVTDSIPDTTAADPFDLRVQQYRDPNAWKLVSIADNAAQVRARVLESSIDATGDMTVTARSTQGIDAIVVAAAVGIGGGSSTGFAVSGAGSYAENKVRTIVQASPDARTICS